MIFRHPITSLPPDKWHGKSFVICSAWCLHFLFFFCNFIWISYCTRAKLDLCEKTLSRSETWKSIHLIISPRCTAPLRLQYNLYLMRHVLSAQISLFWGIWNLPDVTHGVAPTLTKRQRNSFSYLYINIFSNFTFTLCLRSPLLLYSSTWWVVQKE